MSSIAVVLLIWTSGLCLGTVRSEALKINCLEGKSVRLPAPVSKNGLLKTDSGVQASVKNGRLDKVYNRKIHWSSEDGCFYIMNLTITDTGNYNVENQDGQSKITHFSLAVYRLCLGTVRSEAHKINCLEGESVRLPAPVSKNGLLKTDSGVQASVKNGRLDKVYNRKIHWSSEDGCFYIMNLTITDTGNYNVENQDGQSKITHFSLAVYSLCQVTARSEAHKINCLEGKSVQLPAPVSKNGLLKTDSGVQASVKNGHLDKVYNRKIHWSREDGCFYIMNLTITDTGNYNVENQDGQSKITHISLAVYSPVSQPRVQASYSASPSNVSCSLLCSVENGRGVTLSWLTEGRSLISTRNPALSTNLTLQLEAAGLSEPLVCSATNPVDSSITAVRLEDYCQDKTNDSTHLGQE
ncbi:carcinoembryonic antigen-related cell adhesion molecule 1-like isoform X2 [Lepisosteus oculatus]|uniref:carcinoembryonic antigen-related cell adhesion molecule 1-like isoform X2 n=1 Tax=Lepisosteus oculatus TaxID=7918 RepID=UPI003717DBF8